MFPSCSVYMCECILVQYNFVLTQNMYQIDEYKFKKIFLSFSTAEERIHFFDACPSKLVASSLLPFALKEVLGKKSL